MRRLFPVIWAIARRDYVAAVWSRVFVIFLALPLVLGAIGGGFGALGARQSAPPPRAAIVVAPALWPGVSAARARLAAALGDGAAPPVVRGTAIGAGAAFVAGDPGRPRIRLAADAPPDTAAAAGLLLREAGRGAPAAIPVVVSPPAPAAAAPPARDLIGLARAAQYALLILTLMLSGRLLSSFVEERAGKVIEVLAAAAPVDAIFLGKLLGMLLFALTAATAWGLVAAGVAAVAMPGLLAALPAPAIGWPGFAALAILYFAAAFLLTGAVMLGLGARAATPGDIQTLALPTTVAQFLAFGLASAAVDRPDDGLALVAALVPWSSPLAMAARAAVRPEWWPHLAALAWQAGWLALTVRIAAGLFRRSVLGGGGAPARIRRSGTSR